MTLFSFEVPLPHLKEFEPYQDFTFALCFLIYASKDYSTYVDNKCLEDGSHVIIDNSFNETNIPIAAEEMARIFYQFTPSAVIAPDADWWATQTLLQAYDSLCAEVPSTRVMGIYRNDREFYLLRDRSATHIATSYWWRDKISFIPPNTHYLGLGDLADILKTRPRTLDTSIPIKMALRGEHFVDWVAQGGKYTRHYTREAWGPARFERAWKYYQTQMTPAQVDLAIDNILELKAAVNGQATPTTLAAAPELGTAAHSAADE